MCSCNAFLVKDKKLSDWSLLDKSVVEQPLRTKESAAAAVTGTDLAIWAAGHLFVIDLWDVGNVAIGWAFTGSKGESNVLVVARTSCGRHGEPLDTPSP